MKTTFTSIVCAVFMALSTCISLSAQDLKPVTTAHTERNFTTTASSSVAIQSATQFARAVKDVGIVQMSADALAAINSLSTAITQLFPFTNGFGILPDRVYNETNCSTINIPPVVSITSPVNGALFATYNFATVVINANATDPDGTITKVEFFNGAIKIGEDLTAPYSFTWANLPRGNYALTAKATDDMGATTTSAVVNIIVRPPVNAFPSVSITSPVNAAVFTAPATIVINANATDPDGIITKVEFFDGTTKLGEDVTAPYSFTWTAVAAGSYALTAKATDDGFPFMTVTSTTVNVTVNVNIPPSVNITSPLNLARFGANSNITINANATDVDGTITKVEFFRGATKIGEDLTAPYSFTWAAVPPDLYALTAKATDNSGATTTSTVVNIKVSADVNLPPSVNITSPLNLATFAAGSNIIINANATDPDGTITKVEFFNGATKLGEDVKAPYTFTWTAVAAGTYALTAKVTDNFNATTTSATVSIIVNASAGLINGQNSNVSRLHKEIEMSISPNPANQYIGVQVTTDIENDYTLRVFDAIGQNISHQKGLYQQGTNTQILDVSTLQKGIYWLQLTGQEGKPIVKTFVIE